MAVLTERAAEILQESGLSAPEVWEGSGANGTVTAKDAQKHVREHPVQDSPSDMSTTTEPTAVAPSTSKRAPIQLVTLPIVDSTDFLVPGGDGEYQIPRSFPPARQLEIAIEALSDKLGCAAAEVNVLSHHVTPAGQFCVRGHYQKVR